MLSGIAFLILCFGFVLHEQLSDHPMDRTVQSHLGESFKKR